MDDMSVLSEVKVPPKGELLIKEESDEESEFYFDMDIYSKPVLSRIPKVFIYPLPRSVSSSKIKFKTDEMYTAEGAGGTQSVSRSKIKFETNDVYTAEEAGGSLLTPTTSSQQNESENESETNRSPLNSDPRRSFTPTISSSSSSAILFDNGSCSESITESSEDEKEDDDEEKDDAEEVDDDEEDIIKPPPIKKSCNRKTESDIRGRGTYRIPVKGMSDWKQAGKDGKVLEICVNDEDVPNNLKTKITELKCSGCASVVQPLKLGRPKKNGNESEKGDEILADEDYVVQEMFGGDRTALKFHWSPMATFNGQPEKYQRPKTGPTSKTKSAYDAFRKFWDDDILEHICTETNRYAVQLKTESKRFARQWYDTNVKEILILFAFWIMLGIIRMPSINSCFSNNNLLKTNVFRTLMTESRYWILNKALNFVDNSTRTPQSSKLVCLDPIISHLNKKFQQAYVLRQNIVIGESLTSWDGNLSFHQSSKKKSTRLGIKTFELCECETGYLWSFLIYTGRNKNDTLSRLPKSTEVVMKLIEPLLNRGHKLFLDGWFTSPVLARFLKKNKTDCVGTLSINKKYLPEIIQLAKVPRGTCIARQSGDIVVMVHQDKNPIYTISTYHGTDSVALKNKPGERKHFKPCVIVDYNKSMGAFDKKDLMLESYLDERKQISKWYITIFKRLLNVSICNSLILVDRSKDTPVKMENFRLELVQSIIDKHLPFVPQTRLRGPSINTDRRLPDSRFKNGHHFLVRNQVPNDGPRTERKQSYGRQVCVWCNVRNKKSKRSVYICEECQVPLCLEDCFKKFHTIP